MQVPASDTYGAAGLRADSDEDLHRKSDSVFRARNAEYDSGAQCAMRGDAERCHEKGLARIARPKDDQLAASGGRLALPQSALALRLLHRSVDVGIRYLCAQHILLFELRGIGGRESQLSLGIDVRHASALAHSEWDGLRHGSVDHNVHLM